MELQLKGKVAIVTGGSSGIGRAIAEGLAAEGVGIAICARREGPLREAEAALQKLGGAVFAASCDVGDAGALDAFLDACKKQFGRIDILVNNASGFGVIDDEASWSASLDIDLLASVRAARKVSEWMAESGSGSNPAAAFRICIFGCRPASGRHPRFESSIPILKGDPDGLFVHREEAHPQGFRQA